MHRVVEWLVCIDACVLPRLGLVVQVGAARSSVLGVVKDTRPATAPAPAPAPVLAPVLASVSEEGVTLSSPPTLHAAAAAAVAAVSTTVGLSSPSPTTFAPAASGPLPLSGLVRPVSVGSLLSPVPVRSQTLASSSFSPMAAQPNAFGFTAHGQVHHLHQVDVTSTATTPTAFVVGMSPFSPSPQTVSSAPTVPALPVLPATLVTTTPTSSAPIPTSSNLLSSSSRSAANFTSPLPVSRLAASTPTATAAAVTPSASATVLFASPAAASAPAPAPIPTPTSASAPNINPIVPSPTPAPAPVPVPAHVPPTAEPTPLAATAFTAPAATFTDPNSPLLPLLQALSSGVTLDAGARLTHLRKLLHVVKSPASAEHVASNVMAVMEVTILALRDPQVQMRDLATLVVGALVQHFAAAIRPLTARVLGLLLETVHSDSREIRDAAQDALLSVLPALHVPTSYDLILPLLQRPDLPVTQTALRVLSKLIVHDTAEALVARVDTIVSLLAQTMRHEHPDVRKNTVFCFVELYMHLHDRLTPMLQTHLSQSELRLVTIYVTKSMETRAQKQSQQPTSA
jgi:hypothetical protein